MPASPCESLERVASLWASKINHGLADLLEPLLRGCVIGGSDGLARLVDQEHSKWEGPRPMRASQLLQQKGCGRVEIEQNEGQGVRRDVLQPGEEVG